MNVVLETDLAVFIFLLKEMDIIENPNTDCCCLVQRFDVQEMRILNQGNSCADHLVNLREKRDAMRKYGCFREFTQIHESFSFCEHDMSCFY